MKALRNVIILPFWRRVSFRRHDDDCGIRMELDQRC